MLDMERLLLGKHRNQWFSTWLHIRTLRSFKIELMLSPNPD